jgi:hypothetical protein
MWVEVISPLTHCCLYRSLAAEANLAWRCVCHANTCEAHSSKWLVCFLSAKRCCCQSTNRLVALVTASALHHINIHTSLQQAGYEMSGTLHQEFVQPSLLLLTVLLLQCIQCRVCQASSEAEAAELSLLFVCYCRCCNAL